MDLDFRSYVLVTRRRLKGMELVVEGLYTGQITKARIQLQGSKVGILLFQNNAGVQLDFLNWEED